ncbi:MAG: glutamate racemase [Planctomycetes bacterium]|jgi:glutamate racemase|nr:glutamate racemase [Planctomycetota bacterium]
MIGVFDSGVGGLTVLKSFLDFLPQYDYVYLGDNARVPYGNKSQETIYNYTKQAVDFLFARGCKLIIIACNSASAKALRRIQQDYLPLKYPGQKVLGVIRPLVEEIVSENNLRSKKDRINKVGIIGTKATINSEVYCKELIKLDPTLEIIQQAAPLLVPLIEEDWSKKPETKMILKKYLRPLKVRGVQTLILGCTHYPFLLKYIRRLMGKKCLIFDPGVSVARSLMAYLSRHPELAIEKTAKPNYFFYTTDSTEHFKELGEKFLGQKIEKIEKIEL